MLNTICLNNIQPVSIYFCLLPLADYPFSSDIALHSTYNPLNKKTTTMIIFSVLVLILFVFRTEIFGSTKVSHF